MGLLGSYVVILKVNGKSVFGVFKGCTENIILLLTDRMGKIPLELVLEIRTIPDSEVSEVAKNFGLTL